MESVWHATRPPAPRGAGLVEGAHFDTVVAGAGLAGLTTALLLASEDQRVAVLEARQVGAVTTGNTTGKLSLLQGVVLSDILRHHSEAVLRAYVEANRAGQDWLVDFMDHHDVPYQRRPAWTHATTRRGRSALRAEREACRSAGLDVDWTEETELPFAASALTLAGQVQLHPMEVLEALAAEFVALGGIVAEGVRVTDAKSGSPVRITTTDGDLTAERLVLATGVPFLDRGGYFAKLTPQRSYACTYRVPGPIPQGMYLGADRPVRSLRTVPVEGVELLMVGGNGHVTGRSGSPAAAVADLDAWTGQHFPGVERVHAWSAQDYQSINRVPFVGTLPRGGGDIYVATGFNKWGMTNGVAAALNLRAQILGQSLPWADTLSHRVTKPVGGAVSTATLVGGVVVEAARTWVGAELRTVLDAVPAEGEGVTGRGACGLPEAVSTVEGRTCRVSGVCPHMGGVVQWNDAEHSWDCPLHGSRFAADGTVLEGPAVTDLAARD